MKNIPYVLSIIALLTIMLSISSCLMNDDLIPEEHYLDSYSFEGKIGVPGESLVLKGYKINENFRISLNKQSMPYNILSEDSLSLDIDEKMYSGQLVAVYEDDTVFNEYLKVKDKSWHVIHTADHIIQSVDLLNDEEGYYSVGNEVFRLSPTEIQSVLTGQGLEPIQVIDQNTVFIQKTEWKVLRTADGGESWDEFSFPEGFLAYNVHFRTALEGLVIGNFNNNKSSAIFLTEDGGDSWQQVYYSEEITFDYYHKTNIYTLSDQKFKVVDKGSGTLIYSNDGGGSWAKTKLNMPFDFFYEGEMYFLSDNVIWVSNYKGLFNSIDGGINWERKNLGLDNTEDEVAGIHFFDSQNGVVFTREAGVAKTTDGGKSWKMRHIYNGYLGTVDYAGAFLVAGNGYDIMVSEF